MRYVKFAPKFWSNLPWWSCQFTTIHIGSDIVTSYMTISWYDRKYIFHEFIQIRLWKRDDRFLCLAKKIIFKTFIFLGFFVEICRFLHPFLLKIDTNQVEIHSLDKVVSYWDKWTSQKYITSYKSLCGIGRWKCLMCESTNRLMMSQTLSILESLQES